MFGVVGNAIAALRPSSTPRQRAIKCVYVAFARLVLRIRGPIAPVAGQFQDRNQKEAPSLACNARVRTRVWAIHLARVVCLVPR
jgi:hypothetical protein